MIDNFEIDGYYLYNFLTTPYYRYKPKLSNNSRHEILLCSKNFKLEDFINNKDKHLTITI